MDRREQLKFILKTTIMEHPKISDSLKLYIKKKKFEKDVFKSILFKSFLSANGGCGCNQETERVTRIIKKSKKLNKKTV